MLRAIDGFARSIDCAAPSMDPLTAHLSIDRAIIDRSRNYTNCAIDRLRTAEFAQSIDLAKQEYSLKHAHESKCFCASGTLPLDSLCSDSNAFGVEVLPTSTATDHWFAIVRSSAFAVHPFPNLMYNTWLMAYNSGRKWGYAVCVNTVLEVTTQFLVVQLCGIFTVDV